ncbi:hypothetical protein [Psychrobacter sp. JCM 18903]|uniref:hypothetical protein n=1 Tax=Psychrobacter sp. JCM 18903 TaxID=1298610 RepID=UPI0004AD3E67|nr:hypothetical protein [Psychrobacter sp. JCM 18903]
MTNTKKYPYKQIHKPMLALLMCASSISVHAAIISDNSERRIQVRQGSSSNAHIRPSTNNTSYNSGVTMLSGDSMQGLIAQKQLDFDFDDSLSIEENKRMNVNRRALLIIQLTVITATALRTILTIVLILTLLVWILTRG